MECLELQDLILRMSKLFGIAGVRFCLFEKFHNLSALYRDGSFKIILKLKPCRLTTAKETVLMVRIKKEFQ